MTGDKVPNDVVLRPALLRWLPTVLVNDGHEHFDSRRIGHGSEFLFIERGSGFAKAVILRRSHC